MDRNESTGLESPWTTEAIRLEYYLSLDTLRTFASFTSVAMECISNIAYRWHDTAAGPYVCLRPTTQPTEDDWFKATERVVQENDGDSIFMIIDNTGYIPVMNKDSFDRLIKASMKYGIKSSTAAVVVDDAHYETLAKLFEVATEGYGFALKMGVFETVSSAEVWLQDQLDDSRRAQGD